MVPSIDGLMQGEPLKVGDSFEVNREGAERITRDTRTIIDKIRGKIVREGDIIKVSEIRRGGTIVISTEFGDWTAISRRDHDFFSARAPEQESPSGRERR